MLNREKAFSTAFVGLYRQGKPSMGKVRDGFHPADEIQCAYRGNGGTCCAVGFLIPDRNYRVSLEGNSAGVEEVVAAISSKYKDGDYVGSLDRSFLEKMQTQIRDGLWDGTDRVNEREFRADLVRRAEQFVEETELKVDVNLLVKEAKSHA